MFHTRSMAVMEQLFGHDVPLWRKLLTLATFPIWGLAVIAALLLLIPLKVIYMILDITVSIVIEIYGEFIEGQ